MLAKTGGIRVGDIDNGYFQATFDSQLDHDQALYGGPWTIEEHYIAAEPWRIDFHPNFDTIDRALVCVRLPRLPLAYFDEEILKDIGDKLGRVEKIDSNTANGFRGSYAHIYVEIDLRKRLISNYRIKRRVRRMEYEELHTVFFLCGHYGHLEENFTLGLTSSQLTWEEKPKTKQESRMEILEDFGPWMLATRPKRKTHQRKVQKEGVEENSKGSLGACLRSWGQGLKLLSWRIPLTMTKKRGLKRKLTWRWCLMNQGR
ncbi:unnamed protein product [Linum trigynum]|uniref:DUF4283 domain-containing protein n=1 Tax=Linum trigynum TaxID=586398 RepID=A0AAV2GBP0_9ROSI